MNKRGDIPITLLVLGVLAVCGLTIFSFYFSGNSVKKDFVSIEAVEQAKIIREKISLYENIGFNQEEIEEIFGIEPDSLGRYFVSEKGRLSVKYYIGK